MVKRRKRKFGSAIMMELEFPDDENEGSYADPQTQDEEQMDMDIYYQQNIDDIGLGGDVKDQIARIEARKNSAADLSDAYLGDRTHEQNVNNLEEISENLEVLQRAVSYTHLTLPTSRSV